MLLLLIILYTCVIIVVYILLLFIIILFYICVIIVGLSKDCIVLDKVFSKPIDLQLMFVSSVWNLGVSFCFECFLGLFRCIKCFFIVHPMSSCWWFACLLNCIMEMNTKNQ